MKSKILAALFGAISILMMGNCAGAQEISLEDVIEANRTEVLLETYGSFQVTVQNETGFDHFIYINPDVYVWKDDGYMQVCTKEDGACKGEEDGAVYIDRFINPLNTNLVLDQGMEAILFDDTDKEEIIAQTLEDKVLCITTLYDEEESQDYAENIDVELAAGECFCYEYELDTETLRVYSVKEYIQRNDGSREFCRELTVEIDAAKPEGIEDLLAEAKAVETFPAEELRTVTVVVDPGTEQEKTVTQVVKKGSYVLFPNEIGAYDMYLDSEGTTEYDYDNDYESEKNQKIYLIPERD